ncbi:UMP kinase [Candidatus Woesearchaeota archaeon]|nr:UMP kinase [Candidatus Woesearchaeota archaeon]
MPKTIVLSLGGSLIFPDSLDKKFLSDFKKIVVKYAKKKCKFVIICGGGKLARNFQQVASENNKLSNEELDWLGIYATRINAHILKSMFGSFADENVISDPTKKISLKKNVLIASGWKPGWSTDYDAVLLAKNLGIKEVINMSNVDFVYDKDPKKFKDAKRIEKMGWGNYIKMVGAKWTAGMNAPFDPIAAKEARKSGIKVIIIGKDLRNFEDILNNKKFNGTTLS